MKRWYMAAVAGLCAVAPLRAQDGSLAPTAPVVPSPVLHGGGVAPAGGVRSLGQNLWSPLRSPVVPSGAQYTGATPTVGVPCGPVGCGTAGCERGGFSLAKLKAWMCFQYTPTELPKMRPAPYITPIQGLFSCSSAVGCAPCGANGVPVAAPAVVPQPQQPAPQMQPPMKAGAALAPARGAPGASAVTVWQPAPTEFGTVGAKVPVTPIGQKPAAGPVMNAGYRSVSPK